jgi:hypothetical protein
MLGAEPDFILTVCCTRPVLVPGTARTGRANVHAARNLEMAGVAARLGVVISMPAGMEQQCVVRTT